MNPEASDSSGQTSPFSFIIANGSIFEGCSIPDEYACTGAGKTPEIEWNSIPDGTKSLVFILDDPDAPAGTFTHWMVYNISPLIGEIPENADLKTIIPGVKTGLNSANNNDYYPPCPPAGQTHRYVFTLYALDTILSEDNLKRDEIDARMEKHVINKTFVSSVFRK